MFSGLSTLRKAEKKEPTTQDKALQDFLKRQYGGGDPSDEPKRKKKKKSKQGPSAIAIIDGDITGLAPVEEAAPRPARPGLADVDADSDGDEPVVANPEEAEALRLQIEKSKNFYAKGTDGSGWAAAGGDDSEPEPQQQQQQRRRRHDSPSASQGDVSPPRRQRHDTPPRERRNGAAAADGGGGGRLTGRRRSLSPADQSPARRGRARHDSPDLSPPRKPPPAAAAAGGGGDGQSAHADLSPPRRGRQRHGFPDLSPPRKPAAAAAGGRGRSPEASPPRRPRQRHDSPEDVSPPRRRRHDSPAAGDHPPPRRGRESGAQAAAAGSRGDAGDRGGGSSRQQQQQQRMTDGTAAGLVNSRELAEETARLKAQAEERKRRAGGRGEATVYRDKQTGAAITADEYADQVAKSRRKKEPPEEIHVAWKGGLAQQRAAVEAAQQAATESAKAFGRSFDDDADVELRGRDRWGDPMAGKLSKRQGGVGDGFDLPPPVITEANRAMMEASGFNVPQEVPTHSWLRRKVPAPVNRYNMRPGRHWDGVDRSNGFEKEMFKMLNQRNAQELEARMWAQEDM